MASVKSGKHIYVQGTGNTLQSVASDINDAAYCEWDAPSSTLKVYGTSANVRYLRVRSGGTLVIQTGETLEFHNATNDDTRFYVDTGSIFYMQPGSTLDLAEVSGLRPNYTYFYGRIEAIGTAANPWLIKNFRRIFCQETKDNNNSSNDIWHFEHGIIGGCSTANNYAFYFNSIGKRRAHIFRNLEFDDTIGKGQDTSAFTFATGNAGVYDLCTFDNITFTQVERAFYNIGGAHFKATNCTFIKSNTSYHTLSYGAGLQNTRQSLKAYGTRESKLFGQLFSFYDNCSYADDINLYKHMSAYGAQSLHRNVAQNDLSGTPYRAQYNGLVMLWSGNTFADTNPDFYVAQNGEIAYVHSLNINVVDENSNPIEDAIVKITENSGKEELTFVTNSSGDLHSLFDVGAMLTETSQYGNNENTNIETWRDYSFKIYVEGYDTYNSGTIVMDQDRSLNVQMVLSTGTSDTEDFTSVDEVYL